MKVLHICSNTIGGGETYFRNFLSACPDHFLLELSNHNERLAEAYAGTYGSLEKPFSFPQYCWFVYRNKPEMIHAHDAKSLLYALAYHHLPGAYRPRKYFYTKHSVKAKHYPIYDDLQQRYFDMCSAVFCPTEAVKRCMEKYHKAKYVVIPNGTSMQKAFFIPQEDYILSFGRINKLKGYDILLQAYRKSKTLSRLIIFGYPEDKELDGIIRGMPNTSCLGPIDRDSYQFTKLLTAARLVVLPSRVEGFGYTALEALNFRKNPKTLIVSDIEPFREMLGDCVTYFKSEDADDLADKIDHPSTSYMPDGVKEKVLERYSSGAMIEAYLKIYER